MKAIKLSVKKFVLFFTKGKFCSGLILGVGLLGTLSLNSPVDAQNLLWAKRAGSGGSPSIPNDVGQAVAVDRFGNSYITGQFRNAATFGPGQPNQTILTATGAQQEIFIAKYDLNGFLQWAKKITTVQGEGNGIGVDLLGNIYVTGYFNSSGTFAPGEANETTLTATGGLDIFLAKYDNNGNFIWAKKAGSGFYDQAEALAVDSSGNSYVTGRFGDVARFGAGEANQTDLTAPGLAEDIFIAKYDTTGLLQWAKRAGGTGTDQGLGIALDGAGNSYVTGVFSGNAMAPATFGPGEANETMLITPAGGATDLFVAKYNANGLLQWVKRAGEAEADSGVAIAVDQTGNSYATGSFRGSVIFGQGDPNQTTLNSDLGSDIFIAKYNTTGALQWAKRAGWDANEIGQGIAVDAFGSVYLTAYGGGALFGPGEPNETFVGFLGSDDIFVAKLNPDGSLAWAKSAGGVGADRGLGIALDGMGGVLVTGQISNTATFGSGEPNQTMLTSAGLADIFVAKFAAGPIAVDCLSQTLQNAIELAPAGATIAVAGTCNENILIRNEKQRIAIDGGGTATISGPSSNSPTLNVRGKGIVIQNLTITGGSHGVVVNRGSNAVLSNNVIQNTGGDGVKVEQLSFAALVGNTIENNDRDGVSVEENSTARMGFNLDSETSASANTIQNNAGRGITVSGGSSARIIGNVISGNGQEGIQVERDSTGDIAGNAINDNQSHGVKVEKNSLVMLGEDSGASIYETANITASSNTGFGIKCSDGSVADGRLGSLNGGAGAKDFSDSSCSDSLNP